MLFLEDKEWDLRLIALESLAQLGYELDPMTMTALRKLMKECPHETRYYLNHILEHFGLDVSACLSETLKAQDLTVNWEGQQLLKGIQQNKVKNPSWN